MLRQRGQGFFPAAAGKDVEVPRLSLAGAQAKCPVLILDGEFYLPRGTTASSHILKFELPQWKHVPVYELLLNRLASAVGLPVPGCRYPATGHAAAGCFAFLAGWC